MRRTPSIRGLQGNLTLSYTYITAVALLIAELAGLLIFQWSAPTHVFQAEPDVDTMQPLVEDAASFLAQDPPDLDVMQSWLDGLSMPVFNLADADDWLQASFSHFPDRERQTLLVATVEQGVLAVTPVDSHYAGVTDLGRLPGRLDQAMFAEAPLEPGSNAVTFRRSTASVMVMPITGEDEGLLGLLVLVTDLGAAPPSTTSLLVVLGGSLLIFTVLAAGIGTGFGYLTARQLTRRLNHLVQATSAWGGGNFAPHIEDEGSDEIAELAIHLTRLAGQLQSLLVHREEWAAVETRNHLARELHDSIKQQVFAIRMQLGTAQALAATDPAGALQHVNHAEALAGQAQQELSRIIDVLRAPEADVRFLAALRDHLENWAAQTDISLETDLPDAVDLPGENANHLLRIVQEALANIARHSGARTARVELSHQGDGQCQLTISDDGSGFDTAQPRTGFGLKSMQDRAQALGARITVNSGLQGTRIQLNFPASQGRTESDER